MTTPAEVLQLWFPADLAHADEPRFMEQAKFWFRGGADDEIRRRFGPVTEEALSGGLGGWERDLRERLALVLVLDQFPRSLFRESARAFAGAPRAERLSLKTLEAGEHRNLPPYEQTFFAVPLGHSEDLALHDLSVAVAGSLPSLAPPHLRRYYELSAGQAVAHRDVIVRFGRHPHRNQVLGRTPTPEELEYLAKEIPPHKREVKL
jgi:uncharacterized protein (DUF924 family)